MMANPSSRIPMEALTLQHRGLPQILKLCPDSTWVHVTQCQGGEKRGSSFSMHDDRKLIQNQIHQAFGVSLGILAHVASWNFTATLSLNT